MKLQRTPLYDAHRRLGGRLIEFGGWEMPVHYSSIVEEHRTVRQSAGLFDISHMGEIQVVGAGARDFLNSVLTNDARRLQVGQGQYTLMCNDRGGVVDDLYLFRVDDDEYLLIVNASRMEADWDWLQGQLDSTTISQAIRLKNVSDGFGAVALQGPRVVEFINEAIPGGSLRGTLASHITDLKKNQLAVFLFRGISVFVARTGYTGEDGFEILAPAESIQAVWDRLLQAGKAAGLKPVGLGARDTLRLEMGYPLYGQDLNEKITPLEAGLHPFVALTKETFVGQPALVSQKRGDLPRTCVAFTMTGRTAPPRPHYPIWSADHPAAPIGEVTSGTLSPSLQTGIGMGYVPVQFAQPGTPLQIEIRNQRAEAQVVKKPIYNRPVATASK